MCVVSDVFIVALSALVASTVSICPYLSDEKLEIDSNMQLCSVSDRFVASDFMCLSQN